ncbi:MAG: hypothetical protein ACK4E3_11170 [Brevundimonas sp.]|jgi:hypothetical protein|uniref:hypothetical protein n=1 Tax=Brevundimonas sp. TaxID=1871086 RepID=UPI00391D3BF4
MIRAAIRTLSPSAWATVALCALLLIIIALCAVDHRARQSERQRAAEAAQAASSASAGETLARDAIGQSEASASREAAITDQTGRNRDAILSAPDAGNTAGDAGRTGLERLCQRAAYRDDPACR